MRMFQMLAKVIRSEELLRKVTFAKLVSGYEVLNARILAGGGVEYSTTIETHAAFAGKFKECVFRFSKSGARPRMAAQM
jgi:hypothetical protein